VRSAPAGTAPSTLLRAGAALLAVSSAVATSLVVATAASGPPDDPSATGMAHRAVVAQPEHGPDQGQPGQGRGGEHGQGGLHRHLSSGGVLGGGGPAGNPGRALGRPSVAVPGGVLGFPAPSDEQQPPRPVENATDGAATGLPSTGGTSLRTTVTPLGSGRGGAGRSAAPGATTLPDVVLVPPPALPAPPTFRPISPSFAVAPLVVLALGVLLLGGLIGLRIARRSG
jgi:hypothetical protein